MQRVSFFPYLNYLHVLRDCCIVLLRYTALPVCFSACPPSLYLVCICIGYMFVILFLFFVCCFFYTINTDSEISVQLLSVSYPALWFLLSFKMRSALPSENNHKKCFLSIKNWFSLDDHKHHFP